MLEKTCFQRRFDFLETFHLQRKMWKEHQKPKIVKEF